MASIRLRLLEPLAHLKAQGIDIDLYNPARGPAAYDAVIFSKSFGSEAQQIARDVQAAGGSVIFDICDNIFEGKASPKRRRKIAQLRVMLELADVITISTPQLAAQLIAQAPEIEGRCRIIPDVLETMAGAGRTPRPAEARELARLDAFLARHEGALHCVWFGKSQGSLSGFAHIGKAVAELRRFAGRHPVTLTIISNARWRYWLTGYWRKIPVHYMPWSLATFDTALRAHDVAIVPLARNGYTIGKTINRPATAIAAGLGVIADAIDSYEELRPFIALDDWQGGLERYHARPAGQDPDIAAAHAHLLSRYDRTVVGAQWEALLAEVAPRVRDSARAA